MDEKRRGARAGRGLVPGRSGSGRARIAPRSKILNERSFVLRAKQHLGNSEAALQRVSRETTGNEFTQTDREGLLVSPYVQVPVAAARRSTLLSRRLERRAGPGIGRAISNAHPLTRRRGFLHGVAGHAFGNLAQKRARQQQALTRASANLTDDRAKKGGPEALENNRAEKGAPGSCGDPGVRPGTRPFGPRARRCPGSAGARRAFQINGMAGALKAGIPRCSVQHARGL